MTNQCTDILKTVSPELREGLEALASSDRNGKQRAIEAEIKRVQDRQRLLYAALGPNLKAVQEAAEAANEEVLEGVYDSLEDTEVEVPLSDDEVDTSPMRTVQAKASYLREQGFALNERKLDRLEKAELAKRLEKPGSKEGIDAAKAARIAFKSAQKDIDEQYIKYLKDKYSNVLYSIPTTQDNKGFKAALEAVMYTVPDKKGQITDQEKTIESLKELYDKSTNDTVLNIEALAMVLDYFQKHGKGKDFGSNPTAMFLENKLDETYFKFLGKRLENFQTKAFDIENAKEALTTRKGKSRSLLSIVPSIIDFVRSNKLLKKILPKGLKLSGYNLQGIRDLADFDKELDTIIHEKILSSLDSNSPTVSKNAKARNFFVSKGQFVSDDFAKAPIHYLREKISGRLPPNIVTAIAAEGLTWLGTTGKATLYNDDNAISQILSFDSASQVRKGHRDALSRRGTLRTNFVNQIGRNIARNLNIGLNVDSNPDGYFEDRLVTSLGLVAVEALAQADLIQFSKIKNGEFQKLKNHEYKGGPNDDAEVVFIKVKSTVTQDGVPVGTDAVKKKGEQYKAARPFLEEVLKVSASEKMPTFDPKEAEKVNRHIKNSLSRVNDITSEELKAIQSYEVQLNPRAEEIYKAFSNSDSFKRNILGYQDPEEVLEVFKDSTIGKNLSIDQELETYNEARLEGDADRYLLYSVKRNLRVMADSRGLNYQSGKGWHRIAMTDPTWATEITAKELRKFAQTRDNGTPFQDVPEAIQEFFAATAFGLGLKSRDKQGIDKAVEDADLWEDIYTAMQSGVLREGVDAMKARSGKFTAEQEAAVSAATQEGGEQGWSLMVLDAWAQFEQALEKAEKGQDASFTNRMPMEVDGLTNGLAIATLQMPGTSLDAPDMDYLWLQLNRVGIFKPGTYKSYAELLKNDPDARDNYQDLAQRIHNTIDDAINNSNQTPDLSDQKLTQAAAVEFIRRVNKFSDITEAGSFQDVRVGPNGEPTKFGRNEAKQPVMTSGVYSAGLNSVKDQIARDNPYDTAPVPQFYIKLQKVWKDPNLTDTEKANIIANMIQLIADTTKPVDPKLLNGLERNKIGWHNKTYAYTFQPKELFSAKDIEEKGIDKFVKNYKLPQNAIRAVENIVADTLGQIAYNHLEDMLKPQMEIRSNLLAAYKIIAKANEVMFEKRKLQFINTEGKAPSPQEERDIKKQLVKDGWGANYRHINSVKGDYFTYLDFTADSDTEMSEWHDRIDIKSQINLPDIAKNKIAEATKAQVNIHAGSKTGKESQTASIRRDVPDADAIGVSPFVRGNQGMDAAVMGRIYKKYRIFNIYDATVTGTNKAKETSEYSNKVFLDTNMEYSLVEATYERLDEINNWIDHASAFGVDLTPSEIDSIRYVEDPLTKENIYYTWIDEAQDQRQAVKAVREQLFKELEGGVVNQYSKHNAGYNVPITAPQKVVGSQPNTEHAESPGTVRYRQRYQNTLQQTNLRNILEDAKQIESEPLDPNYQAHLDKVTEHILVPGIGAVDDIIFQILEDTKKKVKNNRGVMQASGLKPEKIVIYAGSNARTNPIDMSLQETITHEMLHAVTFGFLEDPNNFQFKKELEGLFNQARKLVTPNDFLRGIENPTAAQREVANERWEYLFNNSEGNRLHEFLAIGLTNPALAEALTEKEYRPRDKLVEELTDINAWKGNFIQQLINLAFKALEWLSGYARRKHKGNIGDSVFKLVQDAIAINAQEGVRLGDRIDQAADSASKWTNEKVKDWAAQIGSFVTGHGWRPADSARAAWIAAVTGEDPRLPKGEQPEAGQPEKVVGVVNMMKKLVSTYAEMETDSGLIKGAKKIGSNLRQELTGLAKEDLKRYRNIRRKATAKIDTLRKRWELTIQKAAQKGFGRKLKKREWKAINEIFLRNDLGSLFGPYSLNQIIEFVKSPQQRANEIRNLKEKIQHEYGRNGVAYGHQAKSLGLMIARGEQLANVVLPQTNAHNIANLRMFAEDDRKPVGNLEAAEQMIDQLASLYALEYTDPSHAVSIDQLLTDEMSRPEGNGFANYLLMHNAFKQMSLEANFNNNKIGTFKGYTAEKLNADVKMEFRPATEQNKKEMYNDGYEFVGTVPRDPIHQNITGDKIPMGIFVNGTGTGRYRSGSMSHTNPSARGSDLMSDLVNAQGPLGKAKAQSQLDQIIKRKQKAALRQFDPNLETETKESAAMIPSLSQETGEITNLRYMMSDANKVKYLKRDDSADSNLGRMFGKIHDKQNTQEINRENVDSMIQDYVELREKEPKLFKYIGLDADDQESVDVFRMLPDDIQNYIKTKTDRKGIYVRNDMHNYILGFREVSITNAVFKKNREIHRNRGTESKVPLWVWTAAQTSENIWKEVVSFARVRTSVLLPDVVFGNILSNVLVLGADGIPPKYIIKKSMEGIKAMRAYEKKREARDELQVKLVAYTTQGKNIKLIESKLNALNDDLRTNPVHEMIEEGLYQAIVEDVNPEAFEAGYTQHIQSTIGEYSSKLAESSAVAGKVVSWGKELSMLPGSKLFAAAMAANQYGDFVARYVMFKYDTEVRKMGKQEAIDKSLDAFIYYDEPSDPHIAAMNDYGVFMFWKFYARIQRVIFKLFKEKPATALMAAVIDWTLPFDEVGISGYALNVDRAFNRLSFVPNFDIAHDAAPWPIGESAIANWIPGL